MMQNVLLGALLLVITCGMHLGAMTLVIRLLGLEGGPVRKWFRRSRAFPVGEVVLVMANVSMLEVLLWAFAYMALGEIKELEAAFYFSMATFTTLGYGDIVLDQSWRLLASFQAATGIIMFGWTTANLMTVVQHSYFGRKLDNQGP